MLGVLWELELCTLLNVLDRTDDPHGLLECLRLARRKVRGCEEF